MARKYQHLKDLLDKPKQLSFGGEHKANLLF